METKDIFTLIFASLSCFAALISVIIAVKSSKKNHELTKKANELQEEANRIQASYKYPGWHDIERYVSVIVQKMNDDGFVPTCIYATSTHHAIIASIIAHRLYFGTDTPTIPIFVGMSHASKTIISRKGFTVEKLADWGYMLLPNNMPINNLDKILIVRAHYGSGIGIRPVIEYFITKFNVKKDNIKTACIARPEVVLFDSPNYSCLKANDIWFPWGKNL